MEAARPRAVELRRRGADSISCCKIQLQKTLRAFADLG